MIGKRKRWRTVTSFKFKTWNQPLVSTRQQTRTDLKAHNPTMTLAIRTSKDKSKIFRNSSNFKKNFFLTEKITWLKDSSNLSKKYKNLTISGSSKMSTSGNSKGAYLKSKISYEMQSWMKRSNSWKKNKNSPWRLLIWNLTLWKERKSSICLSKSNNLKNSQSKMKDIKWEPLTNKWWLGTRKKWTN